MPTLKQEIGVKKVIENYRAKKPKTIGKILTESGYSETSGTIPSKITRGKGWQELMEKYLPDDKLTKKHNQLLEAGKLTQTKYNESELSEEEIKSLFKSQGTKLLLLKRFQETNPKGEVKDYFIAHYKEPDNLTQREVLKEGYKLKGRYEPEQHTVTFGNLTDDELKRKAAAVLGDLTADFTGVEDTEIGKLIEELRSK